MMKRTVAVVLLITFALQFAVSPVPRAHAQFGGVVIDPAHIAESVAGWTATAARYALDQIIKTALATLKKRLLDTITDQIIGWIQGEGDPRFLTDPGGTLSDAANAALGETIQQSQLGFVCSPYQFRLQLALQPTRRFPQRVSCTLDQIITNFESFYNNFSAGGWAAFNESLQPQNNYYGSLIMTWEEANSQIAQRTNLAQQEQVANQGYTPTRQCLEYTDGAGRSTSQNYYDLAKIEQGIKDIREGRPTTALATTYTTLVNNYGLRCTKDQITTPGTAIAKGLEKSLYADLDYILSADDLSTYLAAIADAAINRVIGIGVRGVLGVSPSQTTTGRPTTSGQIDIPPALRNASSTYQGDLALQFRQLKDSLLLQLDRAIGALAEAGTALGTAEVYNNQLVVTLTSTDPTKGLPACLTNKGVSAIDARQVWAKDTLNTANTVTKLEITVLKDKVATDRASIVGPPAPSLYSKVLSANSLNDLARASQEQVSVATANAQDDKIRSGDLQDRVQTTLDEAKRRLEDCKRLP